MDTFVLHTRGIRHVAHLKRANQNTDVKFARTLPPPPCRNNGRSKVDIVLEGGLPVLIEMMHSADVETAHQGTGVVANLAEVVENQGKMVESGEESIRAVYYIAKLRWRVGLSKNCYTHPCLLSYFICETRRESRRPAYVACGVLVARRITHG